jgi:hypothetical protein
MEEYLKEQKIQNMVNYSLESEFVSYEQALSLKKLGFNDDCFYQYVREFDGDGELIPVVSVDNYPTIRNNTQISHHSGGDCFAAPLKQQAFRWFRENYGFIISINYNRFPDMIGKQYYVQFEHRTNIEYYLTYEEAENACVDKLIEICKTKFC